MNLTQKQYEEAIYKLINDPKPLVGCMICTCCSSGRSLQPVPYTEGCDMIKLRCSNCGYTLFFDPTVILKVE